MNQKIIFEVGETIKAISILPMPGKDTAPNLELGRSYKVKGICLDRDGNQHLDVGIPSSLNFVKSHETGEELPEGTKIHWCHPSRFVK
jgi:hypothetical protein